MTKPTKLNVIQPSSKPEGVEVKENLSYEQQTQAYSTWGGKLLQHMDVLHGIQVKKEFKPITIQLAPTEACFTGDTEVPLLNGTSKTLRELAESSVANFWVYSFDTTSKRIVPGLAKRSRLTRRDMPILKITLDNGQEIKCTEDHEFLLRDGTYLKASELSEGTSLMPLYRRLSTAEDDNQTVGYDMFLEPEKAEWVFTHRRVSEALSIRSVTLNDFGVLEDCGRTNDMTVRHHVDCNKLNNDPENLAWMSFIAHRKHHQNLSSSLTLKGAHPFQIYTKTQVHRDSSSHRRSSERMKVVRQYQGFLRTNGLKKEDFSFEQWKNQEYPLPNNHKIARVEPCGRQDVYCLEVERYHNFALSAGVFVSNCDSNCPFCSVSWRPVDKKIPFALIEKGLREFRELGAKSIEITGGGNPLLYKDGDKNINHVIELAHDLGYEIGVITNTEKLSRHIRPENAHKLSWIRISLIKLDEGKTPEDYNFEGFPVEKMGFSYIIYEGTTVKSIENIARLVELNPEIKFVRIASDCLTEKSITIKSDWGDIVKALDVHQKFFIKEIGETFHPFQGGCWVGMIRPYWVWNGVYMCTSHVLKHRNYHDTWKLCESDKIKETWDAMNARFKAGKNPYDINIKEECWKCYYKNNNEILSFVINDLPDKNFA